MTRAVEYLRYSDFGQTEQSIEGQQRDCDRYAADKGYQIIDRYIDRARTGRSDNRTEFQRMMADAKKKLFDVVLVWKYDRFSRNEYQFMFYEQKLEECGVKLVSVMELIPDGAIGTATKGLMRVFAQFYSNDLREKVERGMRETAEKANSCGGAIPFGFMVQNKKLVPDPQTSTAAQQIFRMYADGFNRNEIADWLNSNGYRTRKGKPFCYNSFSAIFTNEKYIGVYSYDGKYRQENAIERLVDMATWDKVQRRLALNRKGPAHGKATVEYFLAGKLYCGHCDMPMSGESTKKGDLRYYYYACSGKKRFKNCKKKNVSKERIERRIAQTIVSSLTDEVIYKVADTVHQIVQSQVGNQSDLERIKSQLAETEKAIANYVDVISKGVHSDSLISALQEAEIRKKGILLAIEQEVARQAAASSPEDIIVFLSQWRNGNIDDPKFMRDLFDILVDRVYLYDDEFKILLRFSENTVFTGKSSDLNVTGSPKIKPSFWVALFFFEYRGFEAPRPAGPGAMPRFSCSGS